MKNNPCFIKNYRWPPKKKLKPLVSLFIKNSIFGNDRDPWAQFHWAFHCDRLSKPVNVPLWSIAPRGSSCFRSSEFVQLSELTSLSRAKLVECSQLLSCRKFMVKGHAKISSSSKVTGCAENSSFSNSDIQTENGRSQCFTPQKCPMKIQCRVHSVYSWTFHWEHVTAITYYAYKFQIFSNIPNYWVALTCFLNFREPSRATPLLQLPATTRQPRLHSA